MRRLPVLAGALWLLVAPAADAAPGPSSLPRVKSGELPGPRVLYKRAPQVPVLDNRRPFRAEPLLVSGTDAFVDGEYLYQDYLYDDRGANTVPLSGSKDPTADVAATPAGDVLYPTAERFAGNAADLVEFRIRPEDKALLYRVTLNTARAKDAAVVGIGIDTDRDGQGSIPWPGGAGIDSPGIDRFILAWGTGGETYRRRGRDPDFGPPRRLKGKAVRMDTRRNQMTIRVPRKVMDPKRRTWGLVAGVGLPGSAEPGGNRFRRVPAGLAPTAETPASGSLIRGAPGVMNLAFRFGEPQKSHAELPLPESDTFPGVGIWFEDAQGDALARGGTGEAYAEVNFRALESGAQGVLNTRHRREQARILPSRLNVPEGVHEEFPAYGGRLQPYMVAVPKGYRHRRHSGLTLALHSLGGTYTQYAVFGRRQFEQLGDDRDSLVVTPHGRGTDGWYTDEGEYDVFEVWADVARNFNLDPDRVALSGYSMGGYGTYKLGTHYPDLFGRAFTVVGPPGNAVWLPPLPPQPLGQAGNSNLVLENARWVPYLNWVAGTDELVPLAGPLAQQQRFDALGLRSTLRIFNPAEHFTLTTLDRWDEARDFLGRARVKHDPWRVNYAFVPDADRRRLGLVHDHAYWVSDLRARDRAGDPMSDPARGEIDARSLVFGEGDAPARPLAAVVDSPGAAGPPLLSTVFGTTWGKAPRQRRRNALDVDLDNVRRATLDGLRARLDPGSPIEVRTSSDGAAEVRLEIPLGRANGSARGGRLELDEDGATLDAGAGDATFRIRPR